MRRPTCLGIAGIEAALEAHLEGHARILHERDQLKGLIQLPRQWLFAERRHSPLESPTHKLRVGVRGRGDDEGVRGPQCLVDGGMTCADLVGQDPGPLRVRVRNHQLRGVRIRRQGPSVQLADAPGSDQADLHASVFSAYSRTCRAMAALSDGGCQLVSCSTMIQPR